MEVAQTLPDSFEKTLKESKRNAAFEDWQRKLKKGDQLPRGKFFAGKKAGKDLIILDEAWRLT